MTAYYTSEKAKYGGTSGTIIPFSQTLPSTNTPNFGDWNTLVPAGYLRCDGSILLARLYPGLSQVIGVGSNCRFAKDPDTLSDDFFQLPDMGSKYIRASRSSGEYFDDVVSFEPGTQKVGAQCQVSTLLGDSVTISYSGTFDVQQQANIPFIGNPLYIPGEDDKTFEDVLTEDNFQSHNHDANVGVFTYLGNWTDSSFIDNGPPGDNEGANEGGNNLVLIDSPSQSESTVRHTHTIEVSSGSELKQNQDFSFSFATTPVSPLGLETTIDLSVNNVIKLDKAVSPYIVVEYIIKI